MLYRIIISNYKSFADDSEFNMLPNPKKTTLKEHVYHPAKLNAVLKTAAIYGANGSGKSNLIAAVRDFRNLAIKSVLSSEHNEARARWQKTNRFRLPVNEQAETIDFLAEFERGGKAYIYVLRVGSQGIATEELHNAPFQKKHRPIFKREGSVTTFSKSPSKEVQGIIGRQLKENPFTSFLSLEGTQHLTADPNIQAAYKWFKEELEIVSVDRKMPQLIQLYRDNHDLSRFLSALVSHIDLGLQDISVRDRNPDDKDIKELLDTMPPRHLDDLGSGDTTIASLFRSDLSDVPLLSVTNAKGERIISEFLFKQIGRESYVGDMGVTSQSLGTLRLLSLIPSLYNAIHSTHTIFIDEIENSIHPLLIRYLLQRFAQAQSKGQLIFSTHQQALLDQHELLRPDEVWLIEKKEGASNLYNLNDFQVHNTLSLSNGYLDGRFGAIPLISEPNDSTDEP